MLKAIMALLKFVHGMFFTMLIPLYNSKYGNNFQSHNLKYCINVATSVEQLDSQSKCLIEQLRILLWTIYSLDVTNMLSVDLLMKNIPELIREIACR